MRHPCASGTDFGPSEGALALDGLPLKPLITAVSLALGHILRFRVVLHTIWTFFGLCRGIRAAVATERDDLPKHLELVQDVVERHARNSFVLKGWSVTLVVAVFLLAVRGAEPTVAMAAVADLLGSRCLLPAAGAHVSRP